MPCNFPTLALDHSRSTLSSVSHPRALFCMALDQIWWWLIGWLQLECQSAIVPACSSAIHRLALSMAKKTIAETKQEVTLRVEFWCVSFGSSKETNCHGAQELAVRETARALVPRCNTKSAVPCILAFVIHARCKCSLCNSQVPRCKMHLHLCLGLGLTSALSCKAAFASRLHLHLGCICI